MRADLRPRTIRTTGAGYRQRVAMPSRVLAVLTTVFLLAGLLVAPASADDPPPPDTTIDFGTPTVIQGTVTVSTSTFDVIGSTLNSADAGSQCTAVATTTYCLGNPQANTITISGSAGVTLGTEPALRWLTDEATDFLVGMYDIPKDDRIASYAEPEIRAYVANRIVGIVNKAAYGQPLTANEQMTLDWLNNRLASQQLVLAQAAYAEWQKYSASPCGYTPPAAPSWVASPVGLPGEVFTYCHLHPGLAVYMLPPMPSADDFRAWGMYRAAAGTGLQYAEPGQSITAQELSGYLALAGTGVAIAAGYGAYGLAHMSVGVAQIGLDALGIALETFHAVTEEIPRAYVIWEAVAVGATSLAGLVAGVIAAVVNIAMISWQFAENMKVGPGLAQAVAVASDNTDPLGLQALKGQNAGKTFPDGSTPYLDNGLTVQLLAMMNSNVGVANDKTEPWAGNAHTGTDLRFKVGTDPADQISVPKPDGTRSTVWFSKDWMIEQTHDKNGNVIGTRAVLGLQYVNTDGLVDIAYRSGSQFQIATFDPADSSKKLTARVGPMSYKSPDGQQLLVGVTGQSAPVLGGLRRGRPGGWCPVPVSTCGRTRWTMRAISSASTPSWTDTPTPGSCPDLFRVPGWTCPSTIGPWAPAQPMAPTSSPTARVSTRPASP